MMYDAHITAYRIWRRHRREWREMLQGVPDDIIKMIALREWWPRVLQ